MRMLTPDFSSPLETPSSKEVSEPVTELLRSPRERVHCRGPGGRSPGGARPTSRRRTTPSGSSDTSELRSSLTLTHDRLKRKLS